MDDLTPCEPHRHAYRGDPETNEPIGRCVRCEMTVAQAEEQAEQADPPAYADLPEDDREAYYAALDAESVREGR